MFIKFKLSYTKISKEAFKVIGNSIGFMKKITELIIFSNDIKIKTQGFVVLLKNL